MSDVVTNPILEGLKSNGVEPTLVAKLRKHLRNIEECIDAGYTHRQIHGWLKQVDIHAPFASYERTVMRLLKARSLPATFSQATVALPSHAASTGSAAQANAQRFHTEPHRGIVLAATVGSCSPAAIHSEKQVDFDQQAGEGQTIMVAPGYHDKPAFSWDPTRRAIPDRE